MSSAKRGNHVLAPDTPHSNKRPRKASTSSQLPGLLDNSLELVPNSLSSDSLNVTDSEFRPLEELPACGRFVLEKNSTFYVSRSLHQRLLFNFNIKLLHHVNYIMDDRLSQSTQEDPDGYIALINFRGREQEVFVHYSITEGSRQLLKAMRMAYKDQSSHILFGTHSQLDFEIKEYLQCLVTDLNESGAESYRAIISNGHHRGQHGQPDFYALSNQLVLLLKENEVPTQVRIDTETGSLTNAVSVAMLVFNHLSCLVVLDALSG